MGSHWSVQRLRHSEKHHLLVERQMENMEWQVTISKLLMKEQLERSIFKQKKNFHPIFFT